ncbi:MAG: hypothetical protein IKC79_02325, partial [Clostridia bacterium]|nr:hypothetical protein [Clostridia bacterium]
LVSYDYEMSVDEYMFIQQAILNPAEGEEIADTNGYTIHTPIFDMMLSLGAPGDVHSYEAIKYAFDELDMKYVRLGEDITITEAQYAEILKYQTPSDPMNPDPDEVENFKFVIESDYKIKIGMNVSTAAELMTAIGKTATYPERQIVITLTSNITLENQDQNEIFNGGDIQNVQIISVDGPYTVTPYTAPGGDPIE